MIPDSNASAPRFTSSGSAADVTVVIPGYGECPYMRQVVSAALDQTVMPRCVIVVHSGPHDPSHMLSSFGSRVRVLHYDDRVWAGDARNIGASLVETEWVAFLDSDMLPERTWLECLLRAAGEAPSRFVVGSCGYAATGGYWGLCRWMIEFSSIHPYMPDRVMEGGGAGNMLISMGAFRRATGFPPGVQAAEDLLLCANLRQLGLANWFCAAAKGGHFNVKGFRHFRAHLYWLGEWGATSRRVGDMPFSATVRWPVLSLLAGPARFILISYRVLRWGRNHRLLWVRLVPGLIIGLAIWNVSFTAAAKSKVTKVLPANAPLSARSNPDSEDGKQTLADLPPPSPMALNSDRPAQDV